MTEDKLEGTGLPAHGLVFLDVSWVLALPLYIYVEPWGRNLEQKPPQSRFHPKVKSPSWTLGPDARVPGVWPLDPVVQKPCGLSPLAQIKCSRTQTFRETSGTPSRDQTLLSHI